MKKKLWLPLFGSVFNNWLMNGNLAENEKNKIELQRKDPGFEKKNKFKN